MNAPKIAVAIATVLLFSSPPAVAEDVYWGAFFEGGDYDRREGQVYGVAWNFPNASAALDRAWRECTDSLGEDCYPRPFVFSTGIPPSIDWEGRHDFAGYKGVHLVSRRCILITESVPEGRAGGDIVRMFFHSEEEARSAYESRERAELGIGERLHQIACNAR